MNPRGQKSSAIHHADSDALEERPQSPMLRLQGLPWRWPLCNSKIPPSLQFCECMCMFSVRLFVTLWTVAHQAPLSVGFSRQEYWSGLHFLLQGIFPTRGWKPVSCLRHWRAGSTTATWEARMYGDVCVSTCITSFPDYFTLQFITKY